MAKQDSGQKGERARPASSAGYGAKVVERVRRGERPVGETCRALDLNGPGGTQPGQAGRERATRRLGSPGESESEELARLRAAVRHLEMERDILKKASW